VQGTAKESGVGEKGNGEDRKGWRGKEKNQHVPASPLTYSKHWIRTSLVELAMSSIHIARTCELTTTPQVITVEI